jgi:hypothetical protein
MIEVHRSDLEKLRDILAVAVDHHQARDLMNAKLHLASTVRLSPLTSELIAELDRVNELLRKD